MKRPQRRIGKLEEKYYLRCHDDEELTKNGQKNKKKRGILFSMATEKYLCFCKKLEEWKNAKRMVMRILI